MSRITPYLRMTQTELNTVRLELQPVLERWLKDWCVIVPKVDVQVIQLEALPLENLWGSDTFWLAVNQPEQWNTLLHLALFEKNKSNLPFTPPALNVIKKSLASLCAGVLNVPTAHPLLNQKPEPLKGSSVLIELSLNTIRASIVLSPAVIMDILEGKCYLPVVNTWQPLVRVLKDVQQSFEAVMGHSELPIQAFLDLSPGDVITLDLTGDAKLNSTKGPIATVIPCSSDQQTAVLIKAFTK